MGRWSTLVSAREHSFFKSANGATGGGRLGVGGHGNEGFGAV